MAACISLGHEHSFKKFDEVFKLPQKRWRWWLGKKGVDAGIYAREIMNPKRVLQEAYKNTNSEGLSTACIISLDSEKNTLCAANVGDSGFFLIRNGRVIYKSPIQQQRFNCPYQLGNAKDNPSAAQELELIVEKDDVLIVGTDGLLDNMNEREIRELVRSVSLKVSRIDFVNNKTT
ncbi:probable protein phosphatase 2C 55 [Nicotiana tomentosiformis]|uniref:Protein phosphatase n=1 Tax=Nicotiana tabacum TaxID=4097 RepID=A0A1S3YI05_TOBAC|nr:PREDICTED: probable protein phosphatase 2C 55 [Nicotiana tabacum]